MSWRRGQPATDRRLGRAAVARLARAQARDDRPYEDSGGGQAQDDCDAQEDSDSD